MANSREDSLYAPNSNDIYIYIYVELSLDYVEVIWYIKRETRG